LSKLIIDKKEYSSRLILGTGKYKDFDETKSALESSGCEMVTVAIRRMNIGQDQASKNLLDYVTPDKYTILPNTAGCYTAKDAIRTCEIAAELLNGEKLIKLEVLSQSKTLFPDIVETIKAAEILVKKDFKVMVYTTDDPIVAKELENIGCECVMPLGSAIGSGIGIINEFNIREIVENATVPIIVDAGVGTASDACIAMELGCDGVLMNTAIACAKEPNIMATAMKYAVIAGREAFLAGRIAKKQSGSPSSPKAGLVTGE
jgi:thiazole synthase|tara:strand:+ start:83 stop:865 length:783 start_codon:yes stop_codon:yes gene_type:complete